MIDESETSYQLKSVPQLLPGAPVLSPYKARQHLDFSACGPGTGWFLTQIYVTFGIKKPAALKAPPSLHG